ncbi:peptide chain release factor N(5)-glutamine methyltransferase [Rickettsia endosymbiont of Cardiosporidium cionae]|uniref:peptide chain release factor N(5)-glutamine methyltransferase n=1 Tax=Rickettsia endosymbiont of Cardiosporidium cionae TaxID=2777155 RepID=UPI001893CC6C|nr:peptide chain release factor N(5)-glutamine methyltransferase [Rickettsia endosymbiont of Cardiosporidium cionae]KAF8818695.1 protein-(glutamine-N5) methyltransferase, release factor-specific [Rickettsia endosymbiont of Cardiosporidium cionae]
MAHNSILLKKALELGKQTMQNIDSRAIDTELILSNAIKRPLEFIITNPGYELTPLETTKFLSMLKRRIKYEPMAYILGYKEFYNRFFFVNNKVLVPRNDSEILITSAINEYKKYSNDQEIKLLEIGTGSGIISITLALELQNQRLKITSTDISNKILELAKKNARYHNTKNIHFIKSNIWQKINSENKFTAIITNPPYVARNEKNLMSKETKLYEPSNSLYAKNNGIYFYQKIISKIDLYLQPKGLLYLEISFNKLTTILKLLKEYNLEILDILYDIQNHPRVIKSQLKL